MKHEGRYQASGVIDKYVCSCGWETHPYYDGAHWAEEDFNKHKKEMETRTKMDEYLEGIMNRSKAIETEPKLGFIDSLKVITATPQYAMFYYFKVSGKYYSEARGLFPAKNDVWSRKELLEVNGGWMPGLTSDASNFRIVIIPEQETVYGWPQIKEIEN